MYLHIYGVSTVRIPSVSMKLTWESVTSTWKLHSMTSWSFTCLRCPTDSRSSPESNIKNGKCKRHTLLITFMCLCMRIKTFTFLIFFFMSIIIISFQANTNQPSYCLLLATVTMQYTYTLLPLVLFPWRQYYSIIEFEGIMIN